MLIELHMIQNFAPSCLNRDDTNTPKDCEFGGHRRARISSQCIKRAIRNEFKARGLLPQEALAVRTKRVVEELTRRLVAAGRPEEGARRATEAALASVGLKSKDDGATEYLLFLGEQEIARVAALIGEYWDELLAEGKKGKPATPDPTKKAIKSALDGGKAADLALFGRMLADLPDKNVDAACQLAHSLSTNRVSMEMDYYTAIDDLKSDEEPGADMIGTVEFNSSCFYRYANVDLEQLQRNLGGDGELARATIRAFVEAAITAIPSGKQNSMAAQNPPSLVLTVVRDGAQPWSLANAFAQPVRPDAGKSLVVKSMEALDDYWRRLADMYGDRDVKARPVCVLEDADLPTLGEQGVDSIGALTTRVMEAIAS